MNSLAGRAASKQVVPLYSRIESLMRNKILSGQFDPEEKLATEAELAQQFKVSKITIRTALARLEGEGLIIRTPGKGTFVAQAIPSKKQFILTNSIVSVFLDATKYEVKPLGINRKKVQNTRYPRDIGSFLGLTNDQEISVVRRVRFLNGVPISFLENFIPTEIASQLTLKALAQKQLLKILKEKMDLSVGRGEMHIEAIPADTDLAQVLKVQIFEPLILAQIRYWFQSGEPFEIVNIFMKPDYFKFRVELDPSGFENF